MFNSINSNLDRVTCYDNERTHTYFSQLKMERIIKDLIAITDIVISMERRRNNHMKHYENKGIKKQLEKFQLSLVNYPHSLLD